jgi:peptidoglycan/LPS O-acetylase OafA/YrhL
MTKRVDLSKSVNKAERFMELEGLRGLAAIVVVIFHAILMFYPGIFYGSEAYSPPVVQNMRFEDNLYGNPVMGLFTGSFSVAIFFVLSGFVLSVGFLKKRDTEIIRRLAIKRYARLMLPALVSILFCYIVIKVGFGAARGETSIITHSNWLAGLWLQIPSLLDAITQGVYGVFADGTSTYNPVLWTIKYEFIGSFIVFGIALLFSASKYRWIVYLFLSLVFISTWYLGFVIGMALADAYVNYNKRLRSIPAWVLGIGLLVGVGLGAFPPTNLDGTVYKWILLPGMTQVQNISFYLTLAATLVILGVLLLPRMNSFFSQSKIAFLGKYTFALYLVHMPILFSLGTTVFIGVYTGNNFHAAALVAATVAFLAIVPIAYLFERYVDAPSIRLSTLLTDMYTEKRAWNNKTRLSGVSSSGYLLNVHRRIAAVLAKR